MVGVSAIVTGLPGGTIEKNRNAELLSPAALVNGALGNRVTITSAEGTDVIENLVTDRATARRVAWRLFSFFACNCHLISARFFPTKPALTMRFCLSN